MGSRVPAGAAVAVAVVAAVVLGSRPAGAATQPGDEMRLNLVLSVGGNPIANLEEEFGTAASGWRYLYNAGGPVGDGANYAPLSFVAGQYSDPTGQIVIGRRPVDATDALAYPPPIEPFFPEQYPSVFLRPGPGRLEDPAGIERAAIVQYTIQPDDLPAGVTGPAQVEVADYDFAVSTLATFPDGMSMRVYGGDDPAPLVEFTDDTFPFPPGSRLVTFLDPTLIPSRAYNVGDTITFAFGSNAISVIPEPAAAALLAPLALLLVRRRRGG